MHFVATCTAGVERLVRYELERQGITVTYGQDRLVWFDGDIQTMMQANIWLRTAQRVYIEVEKTTLTSFDSLFACVEQIDWQKWIPWNTPINISATSIRSTLSHTPTLQSITKKAIIRRLSAGTDEWHENVFYQPIEILILVVADEVHILINTSGLALHKRWYRQETGEAPLKESLAAALVMLSGWRYKTPLYDSFCGSGTIVIEAAMIARNMAPGLHRDFDYLHFPWGSSELHTTVIQSAKTKVFDGKYQIFGSDNDADMIRIAQENAQRAGVSDVIAFSPLACTEVSYIPGSYLVANPPYGRRLTGDLEMIYDEIESLFIHHHLLWGIITSYEDFPHNTDGWTKKNLWNGGEKCQFWQKK